MKIYQNGVRIYPKPKVNRDRMGRFARKARRVLIVSGIAGVLAITAAVNLNATVHYQEAAGDPRELAEAMLAAKITSLENDLLNDLSINCEVKGVKEPDAAIIFDTNNQASLGRYQWQIKSVQHYYKKLYNKDLSRHEAILVALDQHKATALTRDVLFKEAGGYRNWLNCANKLDLAGKVALINKLR